MRSPLVQVCFVEGCGSPVRAKGMCAKHYRADNVYGSPTGGHTKTKEAFRYFRDVVLKYAGDECLIWPYSRQSSGKAQLNREGKMQYVHRLVCEEANGPAPTPEHFVGFSCGNGTNGCVSPRHIRWTLDRQPRKLNSDTKLSVDEVLRVRQIVGTTTQNALAEEYGVSPSFISLIQNNKRLSKAK